MKVKKVIVAEDEGIIALDIIARLKELGIKETNKGTSTGQNWLDAGVRRFKAFRLSMGSK